MSAFEANSQLLECPELGRKAATYQSRFCRAPAERTRRELSIQLSIRPSAVNATNRSRLGEGSAVKLDEKLEFIRQLSGR